jgi:enamine deaminase RidA (YjgF/YER057c/UK114 family)
MTKEVIWTDQLMIPIAHFSHAVKVENVIHVGATAGTDAQRRLAGATPGLVDVSAQIYKMFENLETVLGLLGAGLGDIVRLKTYLADPRSTSLYREIYAKCFGTVRLSHTVVASWGFPLPQAAVELDALAIIGAAAAIHDHDCSQRGRRCGNEHYCTALPFGADGEIAAGDVGAQSQQAFQNLAATLSKAGLSLQEVVNLHVTLSDVRDFAAFETAFQEVFGPPFPSRTVVGSPLQRPEMLVQLESITVVGGGQPIEDPSSPKVLGRASPAMVAGDTIYIGGQIAVEADGKIAWGAEAQTRAAWMSVRRLMESAGFHVDGLLRTNNVLTDWRSYSGFNAGYGANVSDPYPPRTTVLGQLLDPRALVQVEGVAHRYGDVAAIVQAVGFR